MALSPGSLASFGSAFYSEIMRMIPCAIIMMDDTGKIVYFNRGAEELTGYDADEMLGRHCDEIQMRLAHNISDELRAALCPCSGADPWDDECEIRRKDGTAVPVVRKARSVTYEGGAVIGGIQTMMDISVIRRARSEIRQLRRQVSSLGRMGQLVGSSAAMRKLFERIETVAATDAGVLIQGETGTGKELVARTIHRLSARSGMPFLAVNCGAIPEGLVESELFGHVRGAFTGAAGDRAGLFEEADGGIVLLDEVGELPRRTQVKLLRVVQEGEISRVGESALRTVDVRILAATNRNLRAAVKDNRFRDDLYYRLSVVSLVIPPLRERREDIHELVAAFLVRYNEQYGRTVTRLEQDAMTALERYDWPGNVRQLQHAVEHAMAVSPPNAESIRLPDLPPEVCAEDDMRPDKSPGDERKTVTDALAASGGNKARAARMLGISRAGLYKKLKRLNIDV